jgi:hypothetical protein
VAQFIMTREWLHKFSTPGGGWTKKQLRAINVEWPPARGWLKASIGQPISGEQKAAFEQFHIDRQEVLAEQFKEEQKNAAERRQRANSEAVSRKSVVVRKDGVEITVIIRPTKE